MAEAVKLTAEERAGHGTRGARKLRKQGRVPAVVYGLEQPTVSVSLSADDLMKAIRQGARVIDLDQGGKLQKALIRDLQWDPLGHDILHADFARVSADQRITLDVRLEIRGTAPGVAAGGTLVQQLHSIHVECPVISVPESIRVNVGELQLEQAIHVRELTLPAGVVAKADPEAIVVMVAQKAVEEEPAVPGAPVVGESAEPEVITRKKEEAEEPEEK